MKLFNLLLALSVIGTRAFSQGVENSTELPLVIPPSPNATALGKFADHKVGLYNGIPEIDIPLYEIGTNQLKVPVSLSYHAGGVKVSELAGWTGLGWALNAGGVITRSIHGNADESSHGYLNSYSQEDCRYGQDAYSFSHLTAVTKENDTEPDMFYYNFNGRSGKFVINKETGEVHTVPFTNLKVEFLDYSLNSWKVTTGDGTVYLFDTREQSLSTAGPPVAYTSAWYLTSITPALGNQAITFEYSTNYEEYYLPVAETRYRIIGLGEAGCVPERSLLEKITSLMVTPDAKLISKINFPSGSVEFVRGNYRYDIEGGRVLDEILVKDASSVIKRFKLNYSYFRQAADRTADDGLAAANTPSDAGKRLCLESVHVVEPGGTAVSEKYTFSYFEPTGISNPFLPDRVTATAIDHWGFYNGQVGNTGLIPPFIDRLNNFIPGAARYPDETYAKIGTLNKIGFPTGGTVEYEYELNDAESPLLPHTIVPFQGTYVLGSCHIVDAANQFTIANEIASATLVNLKLSGGPVPLFALTCNGNSTIPTINDAGSWIFFQLINITDPLSPFVAYTSSSTVTLGSSTGGTTSINLPNGIYKIKAIRGNSNQTISAPDLTEMYANMNGAFNFDISGSYELTGTKDVGGLRVKRMIKYDPVTQKKEIKRYDYTDAGLSSGRVNYIPFYTYPYAESFSCQTEGGSTQYSADYDVNSSFSQSPLTQMQGSFVGYGKVTVFDEIEGVPGSAGANGKTESYFSNDADLFPYPASDGHSSICFINSFVDDRSVFPFSPSVNREWMRGNLVKQIAYKKISSGYLPVRETVNEYDTDYRGNNNYYVAGSDVKAMKIGIRATPPATVPGGYLFKVHYYFIASRYSKLIQTDEYEYDQGGNRTLQNTNSFKYEDGEHLQLTEQTRINSKGENIISTFRYPSDFKTTSPYSQLYNNHIWNKVIDEATYKSTIGPSNLIEATHTGYAAWDSDPDRVLPTFVSVSTGTSEPEVRLRYHGYDSNGNILTVSKEGGPLVSYKWGYDFKYPIAEVRNAGQGDFAFDDFEGNGLLGSGTSGASVHTGNGAFNGTLNLGYYYPSLIGNNRRLTYFSFDGTKWNYIDVSYTGQTISGTVDDLRIFPVNALIATYTYKPLVGMTSSITPNGITTYYEYDNFQRLKNLKDQNDNIIKHYDYNYKP